MGRPKLLNARHKRQITSVINKLWGQSQGKCEVTAKNIFQSWKGRCCSLVTLRRFLKDEMKIGWRGVSERAQPGVQNSKARVAFVKLALNWTNDHYDEVCWGDCHSFKKLSTLRCLDRYQKQGCRGQYRPLSIHSPLKLRADVHTKASKSMKYNYQQSHFNHLVLASPKLGVFYNQSRGKIWTKEQAKAKLQDARKVWGKKTKRGPKAKMHLVIDNDGCWTGLEKWGAKNGIKLTYLPPNSPDLQYCDARLFSAADKHIAGVWKKKLERAGRKTIRCSNGHYAKTIESCLKHKAFDAYVKRAFQTFRAHLGKIGEAPEWVC